MCPLENPGIYDADLNGCVDTLIGLRDLVASLPERDMSDKIKRSLLSRLDTAIKYFDKGKYESAVKSLELFIAEVQSQKKIYPPTAQMLIQYSINVIEQIRITYLV